MINRKISMKWTFLTINTFLLVVLSISCENPLNILDNKSFYTYPDAYEYPIFSPDGNSIVFFRNKLTKLQRGNEPSFNTDPDSTGVWIMDRDGQNFRMLYKSNPFASRISISSDSKYLYFTDSLSYSLIKYNLETDEAKSIVTSNSPLFSLQLNWAGNYLVVNMSTRFDGGLTIISSDGLSSWVVRHPDSLRSLGIGGTYMNWLPDNETIIFVLGYDSNNKALYSINWRGGAKYLHYLSSIDSGSIRSICVSSDGKLIAFNENKNLYVAQIGNLNVRTLVSPKYGAQPNFPPTGEELLFVAPDETPETEGVGVIWIANRDGSDKKQLTYNIGVEVEY